MGYSPWGHKVKVAQLCATLFNPTDYSLPGYPSMEFSRQEYWSGLLFPSPGHLPNLGIEPESPTLQADALTSGHTHQSIWENVLGYMQVLHHFT